ncbi:FG-GAP-like repeat-containing protein [bacterium]|nr:FG-GAP-like repeat-containing protein [bacterium]
MKVTAVSTIRLIALSLMAMATILPVRAGGPFLVPILDRQDPTNATDDLLRPTQVRWNERMSPPQFYVRTSGQGNQDILLPGVVFPKDSLKPTYAKIMDALNGAISTWNNARFSDFRFSSSVIPSQYAPAIPGTMYMPTQAAIDGYNLITFIDNAQTEANNVASSVMTYFNTDFDPSMYAGQAGTYPSIPFQFVGSMTNRWNAGPGVVVDLNSDNNADVFIPVTSYKAGEIIDCDIIVDPAVTQDLRTWPESYSDVPDGDKPWVSGSLDIQAIITNQLGYAVGLGNSNIQNSVMNVYFEPPTSDYPTDPFERRKLAFDDEMNAGLVNGKNFSGRGSIGGRVLQGELVDSDPTNNGTLSLFVSQAPVFLCVRPDQLAQASELNLGHNVNPSLPNPDNTWSKPLVPDENQGMYRIIAEVLSGYDMTIPAGPGDDVFFPLTPTTGATTPSDTGNPDFNDNPSFITDPVLLLEEGTYTSDYKFAGLPVNDDTGMPIKYALMLSWWPPDPEEPQNPTALYHVYINWIEQMLLPENVMPFPTEYYGGSTTYMPIGDGTAVDPNLLTDNRFDNEFISTEIDAGGRFATAINSGPEFLSGYNNGPRSYVMVKTPKGTFSNREGAIGAVNQAMVINDTQNYSEGSWTRTGDFGLRQRISITPYGGVVGIPQGVQVTYTLTNYSDRPGTFSLRQVLDTIQFGAENPLYVINGASVDNEITLKGRLIPNEIDYQTSLHDPLFSSYITVRGTGTVTPTEVTIAKISALTGSITGTGAALTAPDTKISDSGVALVWDNIALASAETKTFSFIVGFYQPLQTQDGYAPAVVDTTTGEITSGNDDGYHIEAIELTDNKDVDNADLITNTGAADTVTNQNPIPDVAAGNPLMFVPGSGSFPQTDYITMSGAIGDVDNDGDLDIVTAGFGGGQDPIAGRTNRLYLNEQRIEADGSVTYFFRDVTVGDDNIVGTIDDRIKSYEIGSDGKTHPVAAPNDPTVGVVLADFNNDGWLDLFFTNQNARNRFYLNEGRSGFPGYFVDRSAEWLPGILNLGWDEDIFDYPYRAAAADIDSDGDMDLVISEYYPFSDLENTVGWIDSSPTGGDRRPDMTADWFSEPLQFAERVLVNQTKHPPYSLSPSGEFFTDETLGSDDRFGTLTSIKVSFTGMWLDEALNSWMPSELDRMAPIFPALLQFNAGGARSTVQNSPMATGATEPHFGPVEYHTGLDLVSIRERSWRGYISTADVTYPFTAAPTNPPSGSNPPATVVTGSTSGSVPQPAHGADYGVFRNLDIYTNDVTNVSLFGPQYDFLLPDGTPDGYFGCMNYGFDYTYSYLPGATFEQVASAENGDLITTATIGTDGGLFACYTYYDDTLETPTWFFVYDANPLFTGIPDGLPGDAASPEIDGVPPHGRAWSGLLADFLNEGAADIFLATDNDSGAPDFIANAGCSRFSVAYGGLGFQYIVDDPWTWWMPIVFPGATALPGSTDPLAPVGEPYGCTAADFDNDGDIDVFIATTTLEGLEDLDGYNGLGTPATNRVYLNDSLGIFTDRTDTLVGNVNYVSTSAVHGDVDNDGDQDLIVFNALAPTQLLLNQTYTRPPDTNSNRDPKMFFENNITMLPPLMFISLAPPYTVSTIPGVTVRSTVADLNSDNRLDIMQSCGGHFTQEGEYNRILLNTGEPKYGGMRTFKPYNAAVPAPRIANFEAADSGYMYGVIDKPTFNNDTAVGDVDNDGDLDVLMVRQERLGYSEQPTLLINQDVNTISQNSVPDTNNLGDAFFEPAVAGLWPQIYTPGLSPESVNLKRQGQRVLFADFNDDGRADVLIGNGRMDFGCPEALLFNQPVGAEPYHFYDRSETNLPLGSGGVMGVADNTMDMLVGDFDSDGDVDIILANQSTATAPIGFRYLINDGDGLFTDDDPTFVADDSLRRIPKYLDKVPRGIATADFDGLGEATEDKNHNGLLDPGEDVGVVNDSGVRVGAANGVLDWIDKPTETEDLNGNGVLDAGEDVGVIGADGQLGGSGNGQIDTYDRNGDGIITAYRDGIWDGSLDIYISFGPATIGSTLGEINRLLINDPTNQHPGYFTDQTSLRFGDNMPTDPTAGVDVGDIDLDGDIDIVVAKLVGGNTRLVRIWRNDLGKVDGKIRGGFFKDISYEVPYVVGNSLDIYLNVYGDDMTSVVGWANDVDLIDVDGDGDLDFMISCLGNPQAMMSTGAYNVFYVNRVVGDNWNSKAVSHPLLASAPRITGITPRGAARGDLRQIDVYGYNFKPGMTLSFGDGVNIVSMERIDGLNARVTVRVSDDADLGPRKVTVQNPTGGATSTKAGMFNVYDTGLVDGIGKNSVPAADWTLLK